MGLVSGKVALVTGAGAGIGRATALKFFEEGAKVVVSDLNGDGGSETAALIQQKGGDAVFIKTDVTEAAEVEALVASTVGSFGRLDCACNNAGIEGKVVPVADQTVEDFDEVMSINAKGTFLCLKYEIAWMLKNGGGTIVKSCLRCRVGRISRAWALRRVQTCDQRSDQECRFGVFEAGHPREFGLPRRN